VIGKRSRVIRLKPETYNRLLKFKLPEETWDQALNKMFDASDKVKQKDPQAAH
jgi:hypothetical protein